jgi:hypothetical protein
MRSLQTNVVRSFPDAARHLDLPELRKSYQKKSDRRYMTKKPFNLQEALAGKPVVTRDGHPVTEIHELKTATNRHNVVAVVNGSAKSFTKNGAYFSNNPAPFDLFMAIETKTGWVNMYPDGHGYVYPSQEDADEAAASNRIGGKSFPFPYEA